MLFFFSLLSCYCIRKVSHALHPVLVFAQLFGIVPFLSIKNSSSSTCKFSLMKIILRNINCFIVQCSLGVMLYAIIYHPVSSAKVDSYDEVFIGISFINSIVIAIAFVRLSFKLNILYKEWREFDLHVNQVTGKYDVENDNKSAFNSRLILVMFMIMGFIEEFLSKTTDYESTVPCFSRYGSSFEGFTRGIIPSFFKVFTYSHYWGAFVIIISFYRAAILNLSDVFLVTTHHVIHMKLKKFNDGIVRMRHLVSK